MVDDTTVQQKCLNPDDGTVMALQMHWLMVGIETQMMFSAVLIIHCDRVLQSDTMQFQFLPYSSYHTTAQNVLYCPTVEDGEDGIQPPGSRVAAGSFWLGRWC